MAFSDLRLELDVNDLQRAAYAGSNLAAADDMNLMIRPGASSVDELRTFFLFEQHKSMHLYGRLFITSQALVGEDPLGESIPLELRHICGCITMLSILNPASGFVLDLNNPKFNSVLNELAAGAGCKVISGAQKDLIQAMSNDRRTRGGELREQGKTIPLHHDRILESYIADARAET